MATAFLILFAAAGLAGFAALAIRDHRHALDARARLLDPLAAVLAGPRLSLAPDGFPRLSGHWSDGRAVTVEIIPDTLVTRRLPQLWLVVEIEAPANPGRPSFGALARATGAEFYSRVHGLPESLDPPAGIEAALLLRASAGFRRRSMGDWAAAVNVLFADPGLKEIASGPRSVRVIRQAAEGLRSAHVLLRQARFDIEGVPSDLLSRAVADADALLAALTPTRPLKLTA
jgi:hypothetical protein